MELQDAIRRRRMVRAYDPDRPVSRPVIETLLDLAIRAPSAGFTQGWRFLVLDTPEARDVFWLASSDGTPPDSWLSGLRTAPAIIVIYSDKDAYLDRYAEADKGWIDRDESRWPVPYWHIDAGMAALLVLLGAVDIGLAGCFFGIPPDRRSALRRAVDAPARLTPIGAVSLGYPVPDRRSPSLRRGRRPVSEVTCYGSFG
jgi:nitroreductase